jgi:glycosyltransferase involved in cell wall biosynthesis
MIRESAGCAEAQPAAGPASLWIGIDGRNIKLREGTGVAFYARGVAEAIGLLGARAELVTDLLPGEHPDPARPKPGLLREIASGLRVGSREAVPATPPYGRIALGGHGRQYVERLRVLSDLFPDATTRFRLTRKLLALRSSDPPSLMHWTYPLPLHFSGIPNVYTIHDLIPLSQPSLTGIAAGLHRQLIKRIILGGNPIVTASECTRQELIARFGCAEERVTTTYVPVDNGDYVAPTAERVAPRLAALADLVPGQYFLFVGSVEPRKNLAALIRAHRASGVGIPLVLAGPDGWQADRACAVEDRGDSGDVRRLAFLARESLLDLISHAKALLFPSLAEGFGIPLVEAMLLGTPAMTSDRGALAEIAGGAALTIDPTDVRAMAEAIRSLDANAVLRERLTWRGRLRAQTFSPDAHAARLGKVYEALIGRAWTDRSAR